ncbi:MAG: hypothetical protein WAV45_12750, partial [Propionibacteriaceae bacterium]
AYPGPTASRDGLAASRDGPAVLLLTTRPGRRHVGLDSRFPDFRTSGVTPTRFERYKARSDKNHRS